MYSTCTWKMCIVHVARIFTNMITCCMCFISVVPANSPNLSTYMGVSGNPSPNGSPSTQQAPPLSPTSSASVPTPGTFSRSDSGAVVHHHVGSAAPVVMSGGLMSIPMVTSNNNPQGSSGDLMFGKIIIIYMYIVHVCTVCIICVHVCVCVLLLESFM